jgi:hypothetical protein
MYGAIQISRNEPLKLKKLAGQEALFSENYGLE